MSEIKIEKGIPIPEGRPRNRIYPWAEMEVGDSFVVQKPQTICSTMCAQVNSRMKPKRFRAFHEGEGSRIFRIE